MEYPLKEFPDAFLILDVNNRIVAINPTGEKMLDVKQADAVGKLLGEILPNQSFSEDLVELLPDRRKETNLFHSDGRNFYAELRVSSISGANGDILGRILFVRDLDQFCQEQAPRNQKAVLAALQETTFDLHSSLDLNIVLKNIVERACKVLSTSHGYLELLNEETDELEPLVGIGALEESLKFKVVRGEGVAGTVWETGKSLVVRDYDQWPDRLGNFRRGIIRAIVGMPLILKGQVVGVIGVARSAESDAIITEGDVSVLRRFADLAVVALQNARLFEKAQKEIEFRRKTEVELRDANQLLQLQMERVELLQEQLKELAVRDSLTELYNRRYLQEMLEVEFARSKRSETSLAILMMDSDHLKEINDKYGHKAGDDFLIHIANVVRKSIRAGDIACRYGGDEFVVILGNVTEETAFERAEKLRKGIGTHSIVYQNEKASISVSIGIAIFPGHGSSKEVLLQKADQALYQAKQVGKDRVVIYSEERN